MLPLLEHAEFEVLRMAVGDARELADGGDVAAGYECLLVGLVRAQEFADDGEPWAQELAGEYGRALRDYTARFGALRA